MPIESRAHSGQTPLIAAVFFVSGIGALFYQLVWLKYLGLIFGNTIYAAATLIAIYLAGLGIGGYLFARFFRNASPLALYAVLEALIGVCGALSPAAFGLLDRAYVHMFAEFSGSSLPLAITRGVTASLFLLPPTILMGGTLPLLVRWVTGERSVSGRAVSALYSANTFGAAAGVAISGFVTIPMAGLLTTIFCAVLLNFTLAIVAGILSFRESRSSAPDVAETATEALPPSDVPARAILLCSLLMGLASIADEVFWTRILVLHLGSSVYAYALMLFAFLVGIAAGSAAVHRVIHRVDAARLLGVLECALAIVIAAQIHLYAYFPDVLEFLANMVHASSYGSMLLALLLGSLAAIFIPTAIMGATFPLAVRLYAGAGERSESRAVGSIYFVNTIGSITGSLLAGFVLVSLVGSQNGLFLTALVNLGIGTYLLARSPHKERYAWIGGAVAAIALSFLTAAPSSVVKSAGIFTDARAKILVFREDRSGTITLRQFGDEYSLELNGVNVAGTTAGLIQTQKLQGHLPLLLHPNPKRILHIGFGSGGTAYAVSLHPVSQIRIAEISPDVLRVSDGHLRMINHGVLHDPRVKVEINDGRNFVLGTPEKFDVILSDSIHPRYAGNGSLYTEDYFELCKSKLNPGGIVSMWLPLYSLTPSNYLEIVRAFRDAFPDTTVWYVPNEFTIVIGRTEAGPMSLERMRAQMNPRVRADLAEIGVRDEYGLLSYLNLDPAATAALTANVPPHLDDVPTVEYESGRLIERDQSWLVNMVTVFRATSPMGRGVTGADDRAGLQRAARERRARMDENYARLLALLARGNAAGPPSVPTD